MTNAQVADIARQVKEGVAAELAATVIPELKKIAADLERLRKAAKIHDLKTEGDPVAARPWLKLPWPRQCQVRDAFDYLVEHKGQGPEVFNISNACRKTYKNIRNGYPTLERLMAYCYSLPLTEWV